MKVNDNSEEMKMCNCFEQVIAARPQKKFAGKTSGIY
jgi:hypothetical protein